MSEGEEPSAELSVAKENNPESSKELSQRPVQTPRGARKPAKMPDVFISIRQPTQPTLFAPKPKATSVENSIKPDLDSTENTQQLFSNTGDSSAPKLKKTEHRKKTKSKKTK